MLGVFYHNCLKPEEEEKLSEKLKTIEQIKQIPGNEIASSPQENISTRSPLPSLSDHGSSLRKSDFLSSLSSIWNLSSESSEKKPSTSSLLDVLERKRPRHSLEQNDESISESHSSSHSSEEIILSDLSDLDQGVSF